MSADLLDRWAASLFSVERSARYHARREAFFTRLHRLNSFLSIVLGTATVGTIQNQHWPQWIALAAPFAIACLSSMDLVLGFSDRAREHNCLRKRFIGIQRCMLVAPDEEALKKCMDDRLAIETDEPTKMYALDILCHNELLRAKNYSKDDPTERVEYRRVRFLQRWTANVLSWEGAEFPRLT